MRDRTIIGFENEKRTTITGGYEFLTDSPVPIKSSNTEIQK